MIIAIIPADIGLSFNPIRRVPIASLNHMLDAAMTTATSNPGTRDEASARRTPNAYLSQVCISSSERVVSCSHTTKTYSAYV
jgi:hypothetical protein